MEPIDGGLMFLEPQTPSQPAFPFISRGKLLFLLKEDEDTRKLPFFRFVKALIKTVQQVFS